ncbi:replication endonuclease, partial [Escherichia coli]|nr:replication endonuclease [Escherichia coli]
MTAEYIRDWQQPRHAVGREGTGIPAPESALSSWLDAYRVENERRQEMADAAFSATPLGNLINKSLDAQEKQDKTITLAGDARKQARGAVDEAMASLRLLPSYLRDPLIRHLSFLRKKQEADRQKGKKSWQAERYARGNLRKIFERLERTDHRWLTQGYRSLAGRERLDDLLY